MHYPYLSESYLKNPILLSRTFSKKELDLISSYLKEPTLFPDKYPFFQVLFGDHNFKKIFINKRGQYISYLTSVESIARWKRSKNYFDDLNILKKSYQLRLVDLDRLIGELYKKYKMFENDTVLVLGGDHGETIVEHDYLSHGHIPYDEVIKFFHAIHFPNQKQKIEINTQFSQQSIGTLIEKINAGDIKYDYFLRKPSTLVNKETVISYSCIGDVVSLRDTSGWKYILLINDQKDYLFNTLSDPKEMINLVGKFPHIANKFKTEIHDQLAFKELFKETCLK